MADSVHSSQSSYTLALAVGGVEYFIVGTPLYAEALTVEDETGLTFALLESSVVGRVDWAGDAVVAEDEEVSGTGRTHIFVNSIPG